MEEVPVDSYLIDPDKVIKLEARDGLWSVASRMFSTKSQAEAYVSGWNDLVKAIEANNRRH